MSWSHCSYRFGIALLNQFGLSAISINLSMYVQVQACDYIWSSLSDLEAWLCLQWRSAFDSLFVCLLHMNAICFIGLCRKMRLDFLFCGVNMWRSLQDSKETFQQGRAFENICAAWDISQDKERCPAWGAVTTRSVLLRINHKICIKLKFVLLSLALYHAFDFCLM